MKGTDGETLNGLVRNKRKELCQTIVTHIHAAYSRETDDNFIFLLRSCHQFGVPSALCVFKHSYNYYCKPGKSRTDRKSPHVTCISECTIVGAFQRKNKSKKCSWWKERKSSKLRIICLVNYSIKVAYTFNYALLIITAVDISKTTLILLWSAYYFWKMLFKFYKLWW